MLYRDLVRQIVAVVITDAVFCDVNGGREDKGRVKSMKRG